MRTLIATLLAVAALWAFGGTAQAATTQQPNVSFYYGQIYQTSTGKPSFGYQSMAYNATANTYDLCNPHHCGRIVRGVTRTGRIFFHAKTKPGQQLFSGYYVYSVPSGESFSGPWNGSSHLYKRRTVRFGSRTLHMRLVSASLNVYDGRYGSVPVSTCDTASCGK